MVLHALLIIIKLPYLLLLLLLHNIMVVLLSTSIDVQFACLQALATTLASSVLGTM